MRKTLFMALAAALMLGMTACGDDEPNNGNNVGTLGLQVFNHVSNAATGDFVIAKQGAYAFFLNFSKMTTDMTGNVTLEDNENYNFELQDLTMRSGSVGYIVSMPVASVDYGGHTISDYHALLDTRSSGYTRSKVSYVIDGVYKVNGYQETIPFETTVSTITSTDGKTTIDNSGTYNVSVNLSNSDPEYQGASITIASVAFTPTETDGLTYGGFKIEYTPVGYHIYLPAGATPVNHQYGNNYAITEMDMNINLNTYTFTALYKLDNGTKISVEGSM